jgi:3-polyprenyl-4-hydroxybenzoate decarboxylase
VLDKFPRQEAIEEPDLTKLPILKCWPGDGRGTMTQEIKNLVNRRWSEYDI